VRFIRGREYIDWPNVLSQNDADKQVGLLSTNQLINQSR